jgi:hypothetical protein
MKQLRVTLEIAMTVPDDWELAHTSEGSAVLQLPGGTYLDMTMEPLFASDPEDTWASTDDEATLNELLDMVDSEAVRYEFLPG